MPTDRSTEAVLERLIVAGVAMTTRSLMATAGELTFLQWRVLVVLGDAAGGLHVGEIGRRIGASPPSTTRVVRRLERQGLLLPQREEQDRRKVLVRLTDPGQQLRDAVLRHRRDALGLALQATSVELQPVALAALERLARCIEGEPCA